MSVLGFIPPSPGRASPINMDRWQNEREGQGRPASGGALLGSREEPEGTRPFHPRASLSLTSSPRSEDPRCHGASAACVAFEDLLLFYF